MYYGFKETPVNPTLFGIKNSFIKNDGWEGMDCGKSVTGLFSCSFDLYRVYHKFKSVKS